MPSARPRLPTAVIANLNLADLVFFHNLDPLEDTTVGNTQGWTLLKLARKAAQILAHQVRDLDRRLNA